MRLKVCNGGFDMEKKFKINANSTWQELTPGGTIYDAANS